MKTRWHKLKFKNGKELLVQQVFCSDCKRWVEINTKKELCTHGPGKKTMLCPGSGRKTNE